VALCHGKIIAAMWGKNKYATLNISAQVHFEDARTVHMYFLSANKTSNE
jgi:hypothetical protein